jgi:hypothetical protein
VMGTDSEPELRPGRIGQAVDHLPALLTDRTRSSTVGPSELDRDRAESTNA